MSNQEKEIQKIFHDLKQPLTPLSAYTQLLEQDLRSAGLTIEYLPAILSAIQSLSTSIEKAKQETSSLVQSLAQ